jgi:hypothetical protein
MQRRPEPFLPVEVRAVVDELLNQLDIATLRGLDELVRADDVGTDQEGACGDRGYERSVHLAYPAGIGADPPNAGLIVTRKDVRCSIHTSRPARGRPEWHIGGHITSALRIASWRVL